jgi:hypothetical protein
LQQPHSILQLMRKRSDAGDVSLERMYVTSVIILDKKMKRIDYQKMEIHRHLYEDSV